MSSAKGPGFFKREDSGVSPNTAILIGVIVVAVTVVVLALVIPNATSVRPLQPPVVPVMPVPLKPKFPALPFLNPRQPSSPPFDVQCPYCHTLFRVVPGLHGDMPKTGEAIKGHGGPIE